jgi:glutamate--cysteine ligase
MDPSRSGIIERVLRALKPRYEDYVEWALDAGMFLVKRGDKTLPNTGQTFRDFFEHGFGGERATVGDWKLHLNTLFPEARLKNTLEARCADSQSQVLAVALPALWVGLLYDEKALARAEDLAREIELDALIAARPALVTSALSASIGGVPARTYAERLLEIASEGLDRRKILDSRGRSESHHLASLLALVERGYTPADALITGLPTGDGPLAVSELIARTRIDG